MRGLLLVLAGCPSGTLEVGETGERGRDSGSVDSGTDTADTAVDPSLCDALTPLPLDRPRSLGTFTNGEDFTFNEDGQHVSVDAQGNLMGITLDGTQQLLYPGLGTTAGIHMLPDGSVVYADVLNNTVVNLDYRTGDFRIIAAGLSYPNGLDVGRDGKVYVAETGRGGLRRIDPATGESEVIALGLDAPNGVSFGPTWDDLYVGSFGGGAVYRLQREPNDTWSRPEVYALTPEALAPVNDCAEAAVGTRCAASYYGLEGECVSSELGYNVCEIVYDTSSCVGLAVGDPCVTELGQQSIESICVETSAVEGAFCASAPAELVEPCAGNAQGSPCRLEDGTLATCTPTFEGVNICYPQATDYSEYTEPCVDQALGAECTVESWTYPVHGVCQDGSTYGIPGNFCWTAPSLGGEFGMLDGLNVDVCGNVYATAYIAGHVYRWSAAGAAPELVVDVRSSWIPNLHWGNGVGGWEKNVLYMADRQRGGVFPLDVGVEGHGEAYEVAP